MKPDDSYTYYALKPCGCLSWAAVDGPDMADMIASHVRDSVRSGQSTHRIPTEDFRRIPWGCAQHRAERAQRQGKML